MISGAAIRGGSVVLEVVLNCDCVEDEFDELISDMTDEVDI